MSRPTTGPDQASEPGSRTTPSARENWVAVIVIGASLAFIGMMSPAVGAALPTLEFPLVLTLLLVLIGAAILLLGVVRLRRLAKADESTRSTDQQS